MIRLLFYALFAYAVYIVLRFFQNLGRALRPDGTGRPQARLSGQMVKDEACNTYIPREEAIRETIDGTEHSFCSKECRKAFLESRKTGR